MTNRYAGFGDPQAVLDFHEHGVIDGKTVKHETIRFVRESATRRLERVRIITGRGVHSRGEPLVKPQVQRTLGELEREGLVADFGPERLDRGGEGAFFVRLVQDR